MKKNKMKILEMTLFILSILLVAFSLISTILIGITEWPLYFDFSSKGFSYFLTTYSFSIKLLSASVAVFSVWALIHNIHRTRLAFSHNQLSQELSKCEEEIKDITDIKFSPKDVVTVFKYKLNDPHHIEKACQYFDEIANEYLSIDEMIPHFSKLSIYESSGVYRTTTQKLTLRLTRYVIALLELNAVTEDKLLVKYYANKYIPLMIDLYHYRAEIDLELIHLCFQFASVDIKYEFDFSKINDNKHTQVTEKFFQLVKSQKI
ncbi:hypothetical protein [Pseudoalteromonas phenolica]|uniref:hypothetical protein n=1 Tax=Pseudoalteromonas phenolica TaxID=161398 RepID=UPI0038508F5A